MSDDVYKYGLWSYLYYFSQDQHGVVHKVMSSGSYVSVWRAEHKKYITTEHFPLLQLTRCEDQDAAQAMWELAHD